MPTTDSNGIIRYLDSDGAPTPPVLNLGMQSVSDALTRRAGRPIQFVLNEEERAEYVSSETSAGRPPTANSPIYVHRGNGGLESALEWTTNGTTWNTVASGDSGWVACVSSAPFDASGLYVRRRGGLISIRGFIAPTANTTLTSTPVRVAYLPTVARAGYDLPLWPGACNVNNSNIAYQIFPGTGQIYARQIGSNITLTVNSILVPSGWLDLR